MKKIIISAAFFALFAQNTKACSWYDPDYEYFSVFTQNIIRNKAYTPFLLTYSQAFYTDKTATFSDENIVDWQKYFQNKLSYAETYDLVYKISLQDINHLKNGKTTSALFQKLGKDFYSQYQEGLDYLIEAKYLEPYMNIVFVENPDSFYYRADDLKNAGMLNYDKTIIALESLYKNAKNPNIQLRYGYQIVRYQHYNRKYETAVQSFKKYIEPLQLKTAPYYLALDQFAGAQRGLGKKEEANWNFFQVFLHSNTQKASAYSSIRLNDEKAFQDLLSKAKTPQEKEMVYFLLGYQDFNKPLPMMEKIYEINPKSELLQVLAARAINELERSYLPFYYNENTDANAPQINNSKPAESPKLSFWAKIWNYIKSIFGTNTKDGGNDKDLLQNPNRIPFFSKNNNLYNEGNPEDKNTDNSLAELMQFVEKEQGKNPEEFWKISAAYLHFLNKEYAKSTEILEKINSKNPEYIAEIKKMKMLNEVVGQSKIDAAFEKNLYEKYATEFIEKKNENSENKDNEDYYMPDMLNTEGFLRDILANRYFLQGDKAKAFLMNNKLSEFRNNPDENLAEALYDFKNKQNKNDFETKVISENMNDVGNLDAYFQVVFGDFAMRKADFQKANSFYAKASEFGGYPLENRMYNYETGNYETVDTSKLYNGFKNISGLIFGHNIWESFTSEANKTMKAEDFVADFPEITNNMNKLEISKALINLKKIGEGKDEKAAKANQLIGNLLYNTSSLGYFRDIYTMDINNGDGGKFRFAEKPVNFSIYYKNYSSYIFAQPDNFELSIQYYNKALQTTTDREKKARILFQMASAEQGKFYQKDQTLQISYDDVDYDKKMEEWASKMDQLKNEKYRTYFEQLKKNYADTQISKGLMGSCSYYSYFMKK